MGGMIAQTVAIEHPSRVASLISIMSMTGEPEYGEPTPEAMAVADVDAARPIAPMPSAGARDAAVFCSQRYFDLAVAEEQTARAFDRHFYPEGAPRQLAAIYASGTRARRLAHASRRRRSSSTGCDDTLITPSGGERTAELVPGPAC